MTLRITAFLLLWVFSLSAAEDMRLSRELPATLTDVAKHRARFSRTIRPKIDIQDASLREVNQFLAQLFKDFGMTFIAPPDDTIKVSYHATNISQLQLLDDLCAKMNLYWRFSRDGITIGTEETLRRGK